MKTISAFEDAIKKLEKAAAAARLDPDTITLLKHPNKEIEVDFPVEMEDGRLLFFKGFRVQYNNSLGLYKGGLRYHPEVDKEEIKALALWMSLKSALLSLPFGGAKGGVVVEPKSLSEIELERLTRAFTRALYSDIGPGIDIPAPDLNTNSKIMGWIFDEYSKKAGHPVRAVVTGKPLEIGGSKGRNVATGKGGFFVLEEALAKLNLRPPLTVAVQGFGNVGAEIALELYQAGFKVVAVSDSRGGIYLEDGLDIEAVSECKKENSTVAGCYCVNSVCDIKNKDKFGGKEIGSETLLELPVDILIPAALENQINETNASKIKAKLILEMANGPTTSQADEILYQRGITVIPDILANGGGVTVSYFEYYQNVFEETWSEEKVLSQLKERMASAFEQVWELAKEKKINLRAAAYSVAVGRISQAQKL